MQLQGSSFIIRPYRLNDEVSVARHASNPKIARNMGDPWPYPYTVEDARAYIGAPLEEMERPCHLAIARNGEVIGGIGFVVFEGNARIAAEVGYWLGETFWGQGVATEALRLVSAYAFDAFELVRLQARVFEGNLASMRVLEKAGYTLEARLARSCIKDGQIIDVFQYVLLK